MRFAIVVVAAVAAAVGVVVAAAAAAAADVVVVVVVVVVLVLVVKVVPRTTGWTIKWSNSTNSLSIATWDNHGNTKVRKRLCCSIQQGHANLQPCLDRLKLLLDLFAISHFLSKSPQPTTHHSSVMRKPWTRSTRSVSGRQLPKS